MGWTNVTTGQAVKTMTSGYQAITMGANVSLVWPLETLEGVPYVAGEMDVTASVGALSLLMPSALAGTTGIVGTVTNVGGNSFTLADSTGASIGTIGTGASWIIILTSNATAAGAWRLVQLGATTSTAQASALAGPGLVASGSVLQTNELTTPVSINTTLGTTHRGRIVEWTGTSGTFTLDTIANNGVGWYCWVINNGSGALTLNTSGGDTMNTGVSTLNIPPGSAGSSFALRITAAAAKYEVLGSSVNITPPTAGGTGIGNNALSTITISGNFPLTVTLSAPTSVTLPTTGTLATTGSPTFSGTVTMPDGATWTSAAGISLLTKLSSDLIFPDATYDIGKSGATRPRDGFFSRNLVVGNGVQVTGALASGTGIGLPAANSLGLYSNGSEVARALSGNLLVGYTSSQGSYALQATSAYVGGVATVGGVLTGNFSQASAVSGTFYTAIAAAAIQAAGGNSGGNDFDITITLHQNTAGGCYRVIFGNGANTALITLSAATNVTVQIDGSGNFQAEQTTGGPVDLNVTWTRKPV